NRRGELVDVVEGGRERRSGGSVAQQRRLVGRRRLAAGRTNVEAQVVFVRDEASRQPARRTDQRAQVRLQLLHDRSFRVRERERIAVELRRGLLEILGV